MQTLKCEEVGCTNSKAWAFRDVGFWKGKGHKLCDECYGHKYGEQICRQCELGCYDEDMEDNAETYLCGRCRRNEYQEARAIDQMIDADIEFQEHTV